MEFSGIVVELDAEIARLREVRDLLTGVDGRGKVGRPPGKPGHKPKRIRFMSAEARKRIGDAQRKRWAKQKAGK